MTSWGKLRASVPHTALWAVLGKSALLSTLLGTVPGCAANDPDATANEVQRGKALFESGELSPSNLNSYSCRTCHATHAGSQDTRILPGAPLAGAPERQWFWGEQENDLLRAVNACRNYFMVANEALEPEQDAARALYAYLLTLEPADTTTQPFSIVRYIEPLPRGDATQGEVLYNRGCAYCHGAIHTGLGRLNERTSILPEDTLQNHANLSPRMQRLAFSEKVRHGLFLGWGGDMPPFSREVLSDAQLADILEYVGVLGE